MSFDYGIEHTQVYDKHTIATTTSNKDVGFRLVQVFSEAGVLTFHGLGLRSPVV